MKNYEFVFTQFHDEFGDRLVDSITSDEILSFLTRLTEGNNQTTKRNRYSSLKAFFNYIRNTIDFEIKNPCDTPFLRKIFREKRPQQWKIIEKDLIDAFVPKDGSAEDVGVAVQVLEGPWGPAWLAGVIDGKALGSRGIRVIQLSDIVFQCVVWVSNLKTLRRFITN